MSDFLNNLGKIGMVMQAGGGSLAGRDGMGVVREWQQQQDDVKKREAIAGLLAQSGIGGLQRGLLEQLPVDQQPSAILNFIQQQDAQRRAGGAAGAAQARAAQEQAAYSDFMAQFQGGQQQPQSPYSTGVAADFIAPSQPLSMGQPSAMPTAMPAPPVAAPGGLSFGQAATPAPVQEAAPTDAFTGARATYERLLRMPPPPPGTGARKAYDDALKFYERQVEFFAPPEATAPGNDYERYVARVPPGQPVMDEFEYREAVSDARRAENARQRKINEMAADLAAEGMDPVEAERRARGIVDGRITVSDGIMFDKGMGDVDGFEPVDPSAPSGMPGLFGRADDATGVGARAAQVSTDTLGQLPLVGGIFQFPDQVQAQQAYGTATNNLIRSLSINPRFPVAEMQRIERELGFAPSVWRSPEGTQSRMRELDTYLARRVEIEAEFANTQGNPLSERNAARRAVRDIQAFREEMGVPQQSDGATLPPAVASNPQLRSTAERHGVSIEELWENLSPEARKRFEGE